MTPSRSRTETRRLPDEAAFTEVGREEDLHAQFWVVYEGLHAIASILATIKYIVRVARVRVSIIRYGIAVRSRVLEWGRSLLEQADIYAKLENSQATRNLPTLIGVRYPTRAVRPA